MSWASRLRDHLRRRAVVLRRSFVQLLQMAVAVSLSWWVAYDLLGHTQSVFAPVAAAIVVRLAPGMRTKRALEMVAGIAVGIGAGDAIVRVIGTGAVQVGVVVLVAVSAAVLLGAATSSPHRLRGRRSSLPRCRPTGRRRPGSSTRWSAA
jgi:hypothetical protein